MDHEVLLDVVNKDIVVVLDLAEFQEVFRCEGALVRVQIHHKLPQSRLNHYRHDDSSIDGKVLLRSLLHKRGH